MTARSSLWTRPVVAALAIFGALGFLTALIGTLVGHTAQRYPAGWVGAGVVLYNLGALAAAIAILARPALPTRRVVLPAAGVAVLAGCTASVAPVPWPAFLAAVLVVGVGYGMLVVSLNAYFASAFGQANELMVNRLNAVFGIGAISAPLAASALGAAAPWLLPVAVGIVVAIASLAAPAASPSQPVALDRDAPRNGVARLAILTCAVLALAYAGLETSTGSFQTLQLTSLGWPEQPAILASALFWIGLAASRLVLPAVVRFRGGHLWIFLLVATAALALTGGSASAPFGYLVAGLAMGPVFPTLVAFTARISGSPRRATALITLCAMAGNAAVPAAVTATASETGSVFPGLIAAAGCCLVLAGLLAAVIRSRPPAQ